MEITEFRQKLHAYQNFMDSSTFINCFLDAHKKHGDNLELILEDMEKGKIEYQNSIRTYKDAI